MTEMADEWDDGSITLPPELLLHTFAHLQATDLCRAALVCSLWKSVGVTASLWYVQHQTRSSQLYIYSMFVQ